MVSALPVMLFAFQHCCLGLPGLVRFSYRDLHAFGEDYPCRSIFIRLLEEADILQLPLPRGEHLLMHPAAPLVDYVSGGLSR